ncbi:hypothetical protein GCM10009605_25290 [Nocardiopsis composta]
MSAATRARKVSIPAPPSAARSDRPVPTPRIATHMPLVCLSIAGNAWEGVRTASTRANSDVTKMAM